MGKEQTMHGTTICCVRKGNKFAMAGDGQVSLGQTVMKGNATKVRRIYKDSVVVGFAGATADAFTLLDLFEAKLQKFSGNLMRSAVELAKDWRTDRILRRLEAMLIATDGNSMLLISGNGDVLEPEEGVLAIGSGGNYAAAAAKALTDHTDMDAKSIAMEALKIAGDICVYTNQQITIEEIEAQKDK